jgi:two-component sensor histidine kinase
MLAAGHGSSSMDLQVQTCPVQASLDTAVPLGFILNELVINACKHGLRETESGRITIQLAMGQGDELQLTVADNGSGIPPEIQWGRTSGLGSHLLRIFSTQLRGNLEHTSSSQGTSFRLTFRNRQPKGLADVP